MSICAVQEAAKQRKSRLLREADFIKMSQEKGSLLLDCRSKGTI